MNAPSNTVQNKSAGSIRGEAAQRLMEKSLSENWSDAQQADLDNWLGQSLAHRTSYWRLEAAWDQTDRLAALRRPASPQNPASPKKPMAMGDHLPGKTAPSRVHLARYAALLLIVALLGLGYMLQTTNTGPAVKAYATEIGGRQIITLEDGSQIFLNTDSAIRITVTGANRTIWLDRGEAYFDVRNGEKNPFLVHVGNHKIRDIGTKFAIRRSGDQPSEKLRLLVTEGKVELDSTETGEAPVLISAGQQASLNYKQLTIEDKSPESLSSSLTWRNGTIQFAYTSLADAAAEFNRYNRIKIIIRDDATAKHNLVGSFATNDVDAFIRLSQRLFNLKVEQTGSQIILSQKNKSQK